jgi:hypothetical protein
MPQNTVICVSMVDIFLVDLHDRGVLVVRHAKRLVVAVYLRRGVEYHWKKKQHCQLKIKL